MIYIIGIVGLALGLAIAGYFAMRLRSRAELMEQRAQTAEENARKEAERAKQNTEELKAEHRERTEAMKEEFAERLKRAESQYREALEQMHQQHEKQMGQQLAFVKEQMNSASERILKDRAEQLQVSNREQLASILTPLQTHIQQMREAVEKSDREQTATMQRLDAQIKTSFEISREVGERADRLAQALTGENKTQGTFGELRLRQLLEDMGLEEGVQFELQETMLNKQGRTIYDEEGHRMIPDAILHFPDHRDVIIDSKMSFTAFEEYHAAQTEEQQKDALNRHIKSMRAHVNELARKNYSKYIKDDRGKLDFVLMYVFSESALQLALSHAATLWKEAYDKGVVICGSQNLYMMLRVLEMTWRQVRQVENQQEIMRCADELINRVQIFAERLDDVKQQFEKTSEAFHKVEASTAEGGQSILTSARKLLKMGASENPKRKKKLGTNLADSEEKASTLAFTSLPPNEVQSHSDGQGQDQ